MVISKALKADTNPRGYEYLRAFKLLFKQEYL